MYPCNYLLGHFWKIVFVGRFWRREVFFGLKVIYLPFGKSQNHPRFDKKTYARVIHLQFEWVKKKIQREKTTHKEMVDAENDSQHSCGGQVERFCLFIL